MAGTQRTLVFVLTEEWFFASQFWARGLAVKAVRRHGVSQPDHMRRRMGCPRKWWTMAISAWTVAMTTSAMAAK